MKNIWKSLAAVVGATALGISASMAQDSGALVDALVKKGVLTDQEAEEIRADLIKEYNTSAAGKLQIASFVTSLKLYGDVRYRYEYDGRGSSSSATDLHPYQIRNRNRYRVRLGAEFAFTDHFVAGVRVATGPGGNSTNADFGNVNANGQNTGAFGNDSSQNNKIGLDMAWLSYNKAFGLDWLSATVGKQPLAHKFIQGYTWDSDINPEGGLVKLGDFKMDNFYVNATSGAYIYGGVTTDNPFGANTGLNGGDDVWMFINQVTYGWKPAKGYKLEITPGFVNFAGTTKATGAGGAGTNFSGANYSAANPSPVGLNVFTTNVAFEHPLPFDLNGKLWGDYGVNLSSQYRASQLASAGYGGVSGDGARNQFGVVAYQIGKGKGKGSWTFDTAFIYQEAYSWDPNLTDSDWHSGQLNGIGFGIKPTYYFTDSVSASINWRHSTEIQDFKNNTGTSIPGFVTQNGAASQTTKTDLVQVDLMWKF